MKTTNQGRRKVRQKFRDDTRIITMEKKKNIIKGRKEL